MRMSFPFDDAYITFRYAENLAQGWGIVWNIHGPPTEGYTNFLLVVVLAPFAWLGSDLMAVTQVIGIASTVLTALLLFKLVLRFSSNQTSSILAALLYLFHPLTWANALNGLETSLFICLVTAGFYFAYEKRWPLAWGFLTLSCLARPDGALAGAVLLFAVCFWDPAERTSALRTAIPFFFLPMAAYVLFKFFYFGSLLPNSFYVKTGAPTAHGLQNFKGVLRTNVLLLLAAAYAMYRLRDRWKEWLPLALWSGGLLLFYLWPDPLQGFYQRFNWPAIPMLIALVALGFSKWNFRSVAVAIAIVASVIVFHFGPLRRDMALATLDEARTIYRELGTALRQMPHRSAITFAYQDAGAVPYFSQMAHIDLVGLNTTAIARAESDEAAYRALEIAKPELILIPAFNDRTLCWTVFHDGHGKSGSLIPRLIREPFFARYRCVGKIAYLGYDILCYALPDYTAELDRALSSYTWFTPGPIPCLE